MNRRGTNGFKRRYHILGMQYADLDLIRYIAFVAGVFIVFGIPNAVHKHWQAAAASVSLIREVQAEQLPPYTPTERDIVTAVKHGDILLRVWTLESSRGKNGFLYCEHRGLRNDFGYNVANKQCFASLKDEATTVNDWFEEHLKTHSLAESLCIYNEGVNRSDCDYASNFMNLKEVSR